MASVRITWNTLWVVNSNSKFAEKIVSEVITPLSTNQGKYIIKVLSAFVKTNHIFSSRCTNTYSDLKCAGIQCDFLTNIEVFHGIKLFIIWWRKWNTMTPNQGSCW